MPTPSFRQICRYRFDNFMARGGSSIFLSLFLVFAGLFTAITLLRALLIWIFPGELHHGDAGFFHNAYITFLQMTDPGNMSQDINSDGQFKISTVLAGFFGIIILSSFIAFVTTALQEKISALKRGHSKVIEEDHTLILGWNEQRVLEIIRELVIANESEDDACVVVLSPIDKERMDDALRINLGDTKTTRVVTRSGDVSSFANLEIVGVQTCKAIVVVAAGEDAEEKEKAISDAKTIQTILAVTSVRPDDDELTIVAEIFNATHRRIVQDTFARNVVTVDASDILAKILVQTSRSVGLSVVYSEILSFDGCEMYFHHADWGTVAFRDLAFFFPDGVPMGVRQGDGELLINPPLDYELRPDDDVLILADDDSTIDYRETQVAAPADTEVVDQRMEQGIEQELIIGWTNKARTILEQYADYVQDGSEIDIMLREPTEAQRRAIAEADAAIPGVRISLVERNCLDADELLGVEPFRYDNIIILAQSDPDVDLSRVDSENIITLLLLRNIFQEHEAEAASTKLITEVLDSQNHSLVAKAGVKDVIISNRLVSMMLAQVSESRDIKYVYDDLFEEDGSEIYLKPAWLYWHDFPVEISFADMIRAAQNREEVCLGVKRIADEHRADRNFGVTLIPEKTTTFTLARDDCLVVLAEDEL